MIKAIVALGNPGSEYEKTYHNVGVFVAGELARLAESAGKKTLLYKPTTFMNVSGPAIYAWMKMSNLQAGEVLVVHDEGDLQIGDYRFSKSGGSAGHNGVESVISSLGTEEFCRLRVGIRDPKEQSRKKTMDFVLSSWGKNEEADFLKVAEKAWGELTGLFSGEVI